MLFTLIRNYRKLYLNKRLLSPHHSTTLFLVTEVPNHGTFPPFRYLCRPYIQGCSSNWHFHTFSPLLTIMKRIPIISHLIITFYRSFPYTMNSNIRQNYKKWQGNKQPFRRVEWRTVPYLTYSLMSLKV